MKEPLFIRPKKLSKEAATKLSMDPASWGQEILAELLTQYPFFNNFPLAIKFYKQNPETGSAFGFILVKLYNPQQPTNQPPGEQESQSSPGLLQIPFVIRDFMLQKMVVFIDENGDYWPITSERISNYISKLGQQTAQTAPGIAGTPDLEALIRPTTYMNKMSSASLLDKIAGTFTEAEAEKIVETIVNEAPHSVYYNKCLAPTLEKIASLANTEALTPDEIASITLQPNVWQIVYDKNKFFVKYAAREAYNPEIQIFPKTEFDRLSPEEKEYILNNGSLTYVQGARVPDLTEEQLDYKKIDGSKLIKAGVLETYCNGETTEGVLLPLFHRKGAIWLSDDCYAEQPQYCGHFYKLDKMASFRDDELVGSGVFVFPHNDTYYALPAEVRNIVATPLETQITALVDQKPTMIYVSRFIKEPLQKEGAFILPHNTRFVSVNKRVDLPVHMEILTKEATYTNYVTIHKSGNRYTIEGDAVESIPGSERTGIDKHQAKFILGLLGYDEFSASEALEKSGSIPVSYTVGAYKPWKDYVARLHKSASLFVSKFNKHPEIIKYAAQVVPDAQLMENILAPQLLNEANVDIFIQEIPTLMSTLSLLCELLVNAQLGLNIDPYTLERVIYGLDDIISQLNQLANESRSMLRPVERSVEIGNINPQNPVEPVQQQ